jgi:soluble lytic murein transglycosylase-like protein
MHDALTPSPDCGSSKPPLTFPYRPSPKVSKHSSNLQRKADIRPMADATALFRSLQTIASVIAAIAPFMLQTGALTLCETSARTQTATRSGSIDRFVRFIDEASDRFAVPASWIRAVVQVESGGDELARSSRGAMGLMQLMPSTWVELSARYGLDLDPFDARDNILAGTGYLKEMYNRFGSAGFLAAYYAGPARYEQHLMTSQPLPPETMAYVAAVTPLLDSGHSENTAFRIRRAVPWREAPLFVERTEVR